MRFDHNLRTTLIAVMVMVLCFLFGGCAQQQSREGAGTIGIAMPSKTIERWSRDGEYLKKSFEAHGYDVELRYSDDDINHQINDIQVLIADDVDLLIIVAIDGSALFRTLEDAEFKHIPVIAYDRLIMNTDAVDCYVSFDNYRVGALQAQFIEERLGLEDSRDSFNIELVSGDPADNNAIYYYNGARDVLQPYLDSGKLKIPSRKLEFLQTCTPGWSTDEAYENMQNILASYYSDKTRLDAGRHTGSVQRLCRRQHTGRDRAGRRHSDSPGHRRRPTDHDHIQKREQRSGHRRRSGGRHAEGEASRRFPHRRIIS